LIKMTSNTAFGAAILLLCLFAITSITSAVAAAADNSSPEPSVMNHDPRIHHSVIQSASAERPRNGCATVAELKDGALLAVYHSNSEGAAGDFAPTKIWSRVSRDGGITWREPRMLVDIVEGDFNVQAPGLVRLRSGDLLMNCLRAHTKSSSTMCIFRSTDEGQTFVEEAPVWEKSEGMLLQGGASSMVQLQSGRVVLPFHGGTGKQGKQKNFAACYLSDDEGSTWHRSQSQIELAGRGAMEPSVAEMGDGTLVMSLRTVLGGPYVCRSSDQGETWSEPKFTGLEGGQSCTVLRRIPGSERLVLIFNNSKFEPKHHHQGKRSPLVAAVSDDRGETWRVLGELMGGPHEYNNPDCYFLSNGDALVTVQFNRTPFERQRINLRAMVIERSWFFAEELK